MGRTAMSPRLEKRLAAGAAVREVVVGLSDGLTIPFALAVGVTGAVVESRLAVTAGLAEIAAGAIAMGLGGYLAARGDARHYASAARREETEIFTQADAETKEVRGIFEHYGLTSAESATVLQSLRRRPKDWVAFMMRFELGLEPPETGRAWKSAVTIAAAYGVGGCIPLGASLVLDGPREALGAATDLALVALAIFGAAKGQFTGTPIWRSALQTMLSAGGVAAAAFGLACWFF